MLPQPELRLCFRSQAPVSGKNPARSSPRLAHIRAVATANISCGLGGFALLLSSPCSRFSLAAFSSAANFPPRIAQASTDPETVTGSSIQYEWGSLIIGRARATRSVRPAATRVLTWSALLILPATMVAIPSSLRIRSANGVWYMRP